MATKSSPDESVLAALESVIRQRQSDSAQHSYVSKLLSAEPQMLGAKIIEEAAELVEAAEVRDRSAVVHEAADLIFHCLVLLRQQDIAQSEVWSELERRFGVSGLAEKALRSSQESR